MRATLACLKKASRAASSSVSGARKDIPTNSSSLYILFALGNASHPDTKHSIGHLLIDSLAYKAEQEGASALGKRAPKVPPRFLPDPSLEAVTHAVSLPGDPATGCAAQDLLFVKSRLPMNGNGLSTKQLDRRYPGVVKDKRFILIQDDVDTPPLEYKVDVKGGGASAARGHNGVKSVHSHLGTLAFPRVKVGIGRPELKKDMPTWVMDPLMAEQIQSCSAQGTITDDVYAYIRSLAQKSPFKGE